MGRGAIEFPFLEADAPALEDCNLKRGPQGVRIALAYWSKSSEHRN